MRHHEMDRFKSWFDSMNLARLDKGFPIIESFYPYDFLKGRRESGQEAYREFNGIVFLKAKEDDIKELIDDKWNQAFYVRLRYFYDTMTHKPATISEKLMNEFFTHCVKYRGRFELIPSIDGIEAKDRVEIKQGPFAGHQALVVSVRHSKGELNLQLAIELVTGLMYIKMSEVKANQVVILDRQPTDAIRNDFIEYTQEKILTIYSHRVNTVNDKETRKKDLQILNRLSRYRYYQVENFAAKVHFTALMLICARLRKNVTDEASLKEEVLRLLAEINKRSESKASTDIRAYLWIALYICTDDPNYRDACKEYIRTANPKSAKLRKFVRLMRKGKKV